MQRNHEAIEIQSKASNHIKLGIAHSKRMEIDLALVNFNLAVELSEPLELGNCYFSRGEFYYSIGKNIAALADYTKAIAHETDATLLAKFHYARGQVHEVLGKIEITIADYYRVMQLVPNDDQLNKTVEFSIDYLFAHHKIDTAKFLAEIKYFPNLIQISLLRACLSQNSTLGKCIAKNETYINQVFRTNVVWENSFTQIKNRLTYLENSMLLSICLIIPKFKQLGLCSDLIKYITKFSLELHDLKFTTSLECAFFAPAKKLPSQALLNETESADKQKIAGRR